VDKRLRDEDVAPYEISLTKKDGSEVPVLVRGANIIYHQKPAIEFVFDDITERKRLEGTGTVFAALGGVSGREDRGTAEK